MIRFTHRAFGFAAVALSISLLTACAEGEAPAAQEEETPTPGEVISAEFPGGAAKVMEFIAGEVTYPEAAKADGVEGKVFVEFTIAETGAVTNVFVKKPLHPALGQRGHRRGRGHAGLVSRHEGRQAGRHDHHPAHLLQAVIFPPV